MTELFFDEEELRDANVFPIHCPMCGPGHSVVECLQDEDGKWRVSCGACGLHGGFRADNDKIKTIQHWNQRPAESFHEVKAAVYNRGLRNCLAMATKVIRKPLDEDQFKNWQAIMRFCEQAGVTLSPLREESAHN